LGSELSQRLFFSLIIRTNINSTAMVRMKHVPIRRNSMTHMLSRYSITAMTDSCELGVH